MKRPKGDSGRKGMKSSSCFCTVKNLGIRVSFGGKRLSSWDSCASGCAVSPGAETMGLGKPVCCYLRPDENKFFFEIFPRYENLPNVMAKADIINEVWKRLFDDPKQRAQCGVCACKCAQEQISKEKDAGDFSDLLLERYISPIRRSVNIRLLWMRSSIMQNCETEKSCDLADWASGHQIPQEWEFFCGWW